MGFIIDDQRYRADMAELAAYRATGLSPKDVCRLMVHDPAPLPLPLDEDDFSVAAGILVDDGDGPAMRAQDAYLDAQWDK